MAHHLVLLLIFVGQIESSFVPQSRIYSFLPCWQQSGTTQCATTTTTTNMVGRAIRTETTTTPPSKSVDKNKENQKQIIPTARSVAASLLIMPNGNDEFVLSKLDSDPAFLSLDQRDRSFVRLLVTTVERRMGQIDKVLTLLCTNTIGNKKHRGAADKLVEACLRIGAVQLLFLEVAPHAAVKETVQILRRNPLIHVPEAKIKFVNAVLRRIAREGEQFLADHTSAMDNVAPWLYQEWENTWGDDRAKKICHACMTQSPVYLSVNTVTNTTKNERLQSYEQVRTLFGDDSILLPHGSIRVGDSVKGLVSEWPLYKEGGWWVQDASAAVPAIALLNALQVHDGRNISQLHVVDLCAAPGGKTAQLLSFGVGKVTALEMSSRRSKRLEENLQRLGLDTNCHVVVTDGTSWKPNFNDAAVAGVLVDAPCSATGTGSRRPDVLRRSEDLGNLLESQHRLAVHAANEILDVGGIMVYSTCSLLKQESEDQICKLLNRETGALLETIPFTEGEIPGFDSAIDDNGWLRVLPGSIDFPCDGFFVARLRKVQHVK